MNSNRKLIDADALTIQVLKKAMDDAFLNGNADMHRLLIQVIAHQPTIDAIPIDYLRSQVDSGKWEEIITRWKEVDTPTVDTPTVDTEPHWIPCSERLPEERGFYLTTTKDKAVYCDFWNGDNFDRTEMVIAWTPLPEPYRGGRS